MGKLAVYKYVAIMFLVVQIIVSLFTFMGLFGGDVTPVGNTARAMLVYALPLLICANILLIFYWLIRRRWLFVLIPVITVACCIPYMGTLIQFRSLDKSAEGKTGLKIASYNVAMFGRETSGFMALDIFAEMRRQKVDVLCMQEYSETSGDKKNSDTYKEYFPYMKIGRGDMVIYSRYPIKESKTILFDDTNNSAMWADIETKGGMQIRVFNVHLQTTGINRTLHQAGKLRFQNHDIQTSRVLNAIIGNYMLGMMFRVGQAVTVANEKRSSEKPCILCGDFNDIPYSYVYKTMLGNMVDGFKECGSGGFMYTMRDKHKPVRIDYIFHDESLKGLSYYRGELTNSDHFPVFMKIAL
jgi:endonuclease/exonuclease/phosphatase family metal-dependent hydrolase